MVLRRTRTAGGAVNTYVEVIQNSRHPSHILIHRTDTERTDALDIIRGSDVAGKWYTGRVGRSPRLFVGRSCSKVGYF